MTRHGSDKPEVTVKSYRRMGMIVRGGRFDFSHYLSHRKRSVHFCWKYQGWGIDLSIYEDLKVRDISVVIIHDVEADLDFYATLDTWERFGVTDRLRDDQEEQVFLEESHFEILD